MFGFMRKSVSPVEIPGEQRVDDFESVLRLLVENDLTVAVNGNLSSYVSERRKNQSERDAHLAKVEDIAEALTVFRRLYKASDALGSLRRWVEARVERDAIIQRVSFDTYSDKVEVARSRVMVKAIRAGLDRSEAFYNLLDASSVVEVERIERWVERTEAFKAVSS